MNNFVNIAEGAMVGLFSFKALTEIWLWLVDGQADIRQTYRQTECQSSVIRLYFSLEYLTLFTTLISSASERYTFCFNITHLGI